jgi:hypothetical protein
MATKRVFFLCRLREGVDRAEYEQWVRDVDIPTALAVPAIVSYEVVRLDGPVRDGAVPYDYVEVIEISTDMDTYKQDLEGIPDRPRFIAEWRSFVGETDAVHGTVIE